ncbi:hypothetical protein C8J56DRAFT_1057734 [Mycena floridula]|nr:hypothetical protein C8J56DRAFT_1057734 [Mycena floridula]
MADHSLDSSHLDTGKIIKPLDAGTHRRVYALSSPIHCVSMTMLQCMLFFVLLSFISEASALITVSIPKIIVAGQPFQVSWTRSATDPTSFFVELLQDEAVVVQGVPALAKTTAGVIPIPQVDLNPGQVFESSGLYFVRATDAVEGGNTLGESNVFEIRASTPASSLSAPPSPSSAVTGFTPSQTTPKAAQTRTATQDSPHSSLSTDLAGPISAIVKSISSKSASATAQRYCNYHESSSALVNLTLAQCSISVTISSDTSYLSTRSGSRTTISVTPVASPSPSRFISNQHPAASKLPIIIGCGIAAVVVCASLTFLLSYLHRRSRQRRRNQGPKLVSPFTDSQPVSIRWVPGKVRQPFTMANDSRTSNTKTGTTSHKSPGDLALEATTSGTVIDTPDHPLRDNTDTDEEFPLAAVVEIERLRLENRALRRHIESSSPVAETLPPSYSGRQSSSSSDTHES